MKSQHIELVNTDTTGLPPIQCCRDLELFAFPPPCTCLVMFTNQRSAHFNSLLLFFSHNMIAERLILDLGKKSELQRATFSWSLWGKKALPSTAAEIDA